MHKAYTDGESSSSSKGMLAGLLVPAVSAVGRAMLSCE